MAELKWISYIDGSPKRIGRDAPQAFFDKKNPAQEVQEKGAISYNYSSHDVTWKHNNPFYEELETLHIDNRRAVRCFSNITKDRAGQPFLYYITTDNLIELIKHGRVNCPRITGNFVFHKLTLRYKSTYGLRMI